MEHESGPWYVGTMTGSGQGLIIDESTGRNVAVAYDEKDTPLLSAAPDLLAELKRMVMYYEPGETRAEAMAKIRDAQAAIVEATNE